MFPSSAEPGRAPYHREQFGALGRRAEVEILAGVPWTPGRLVAGRRASVRREVIDGLSVWHPRIARLPGLPGLSGALMAGAALPSAWLRARALRPDVVLAGSAYPDGAAASAIARVLNLPLVVKVHGPELEGAAANRLAQRQLESVLRHAARVVVACDALRASVVELGAPPEGVRLVYDGVDRHRFRPRDHREARRRNGLPIERDLVLYAGHLTEASGMPVFLDAVERLLRRRAGLTFVVAGDGPLEGLLHDRAEQRGTRSEIIPVGRLPQSDMAEYMAASDVVCVLGTRRGLPSVIREALASGRPVVAEDAGGAPEVLGSLTLGRLARRGDPAAIARAIEDELDAPAVPPATRVAFASIPTWDDSASRLHAVLEEAASEGRARLR